MHKYKQTAITYKFPILGTIERSQRGAANEVISLYADDDVTSLICPTIPLRNDSVHTSHICAFRELVRGFIIFIAGGSTWINLILLRVRRCFFPIPSLVYVTLVINAN